MTNDDNYNTKTGENKQNDKGNANDNDYDQTIRQDMP